MEGQPPDLDSNAPSGDRSDEWEILNKNRKHALAPLTRAPSATCYGFLMTLTRLVGLSVGRSLGPSVSRLCGPAWVRWKDRRAGKEHQKEDQLGVRKSVSNRAFRRLESEVITRAASAGCGWLERCAV